MKYKRMATTDLTGNRRREVRMYVILHISESSAKGPSIRMSKATASTIIATGTGNLRPLLRQGRLMADHGGLYSNTKLRQIEATEGQGGMRARCFSYCTGGKRRGTGRAACSLVALYEYSLVRGVEATQGLCAACLSLVKKKDKTTHVGLERAVF
jgi:hypothetical protein